MKEGSKEYKNLVMRIRKFCMSYGRLGYLRAAWTDRRKLPFKVKFYYGEKNGFFLPHLGVISILDPYTDKEEVLKSVRKKFPSLLFKPEFFAGERKINIYIKP